MSDRYPGGLIRKTPPTITPPVNGEGGSASGIWTLSDVAENEKAGTWPKKVIPRELYAWGSNTSGPIGDGTVVSKSSPVQIGALLDWSQISAGNSNNFAVKKDGTLWSWGSNTLGALGQNSAINFSSPVQIGALTNWAKVSAKSRSILAIKTDGTLWSWGSNSFGQLGDGTAVTKSSPVQIGALTNWAEAGAGFAHSLAVTTDGELYAWGNPASGRLGNNTALSSKSSPIQIGALTNWAKVDGGNIHSVALKTNGTLWSWGGNGNGQLGLNTAYTINSSSPVQIGALTTWSQISVGFIENSAVKTDGTLWAWGYNGKGNLGDGTVIGRSSPVQVAGTNWAQATQNFYHTAAVKTDGTLWAWGDNSPGGELGDGTVIDRSSPVQVGALSNWSLVSAGSSHTVAITSE